MGANFGKTLAFKLVIPAVLVISLGAWATLSKIKSDVRLEVGTSLTTIVKSTQQAAHTWFRQSRSDAMFWASTKEVRDLSAALLNAPRKKDVLLTLPAQSRLLAWLRPVAASKGYRGFSIVGPENINLSSSRDENIGMVNPAAAQHDFLEKIWSGETAISLPQSLPDISANSAKTVQTMFVGAPIKSSSGTIASILLFSINPSLDFTAIFTTRPHGSVRRDLRLRWIGTAHQREPI